MFKLGSAGQNILEALESRLGLSSNEESLRARVEIHLNEISTNLHNLWELGGELLVRIDKLCDKGVVIGNLLESVQSSIQDERQKQFRVLDIKVRFAIAYLHSPEPDDLETINQALDLVLESMELSDQAKGFLETIVDTFEDVQILIDTMRSELRESGFRFSNWESPDLMDKSLLAMNRSAAGLLASQRAFEQARLSTFKAGESQY